MSDVPEAPVDEISSKNEIKTPEKSEEKNAKEESTTNPNFVTPKKETNCKPDLKTPDSKNKINGSVEDKTEEQKTPEKVIKNGDLKLRRQHEVEALCEEEEGMISTTEQARLLIAASKTPSKSTNRTPDKQCTPNRKRPQEESATTPGKYRRVELITLSSPKVKH